MSDAVVPARPVNREEFSRALIEFIRGPLAQRHSRLREPIELAGSTPLFDTGIIDSLGIIDLLAFVEEVIGARVPIRMVDMRYFGTVDRIARAFARHPEDL
jgi:acyl carrier protein